MLAAVSVVLMSIGTILPIATYAAPVLCMLLGQVVLKLCGSRIAWVWYAAVALLSLLMGPDKEAAAVFVLLGYYPIVKPKLEKSSLHVLWKLLLFNSAVILLYTVLIHLLGISDVMAETEELGIIGLVIMLALGNLVFFLLDRLLTMLQKKTENRKRREK